MSDSNEQRLGLFYMDTYMLEQFLRLKPGSIQRVEWDMSRNQLGVLIKGEEFDVIPVGNVVPEIYPTTEIMCIPRIVKLA